MDFRKLSPDEVRNWTQKVVGLVIREGINVKEAYYRIHDNNTPVIYLRMRNGVLANIQVTIRQDQIEELADRIAKGSN